MEQPHDAPVLDGDDDRLVRVEAAVCVFGEEPIHDHGVLLARRDVVAVRAQRPPRAAAEHIEGAS